MDRRKRILVNKYEEITHKTLQEAVSKADAQVFAKVRVADVLQIERSGITDQEYSYALSAHFDFVIAAADSSAEFAVEFDGRQHSIDSAVIERDALKNSICKKLGLPLLRLGTEDLRQIGRFRLIGWLTEVWFLQKAFYEAQERGEVAYDEDFHFGFILGLGYFKDGTFVEIDISDAKASLDILASLNRDKIKVVPTTPYDPFAHYRILIQRLYRKGVCLHPVPEHMSARHPKGYHIGVAIVQLPDGRTIIGQGRCQLFGFQTISSHELCEDLAVLDAAEKLQKYQKGEYHPSTSGEADLWRRRMAQWGSYA